MNYIKEPDGVVFHVVNKPLTPEEDKMVSDYIKKRKAELAQEENAKTLGIGRMKRKNVLQ